MRKLAAVAVLLFVSAFAYAQAKPCEELKGEIAKKLDDKGVKGYSLEVVAKEKDEAGAKVVGTCEGGAKKIVYSRESASSKAEAPTKTATPAAKKQ